MDIRIKGGFLAVVLIGLGGCIAHPKVVPPVTAAENDMPCEKIVTEIQEAEKYRVEARTEDKFKASYIVVPAGVISIYNINKAEKAAITRKEGLIQLAKTKDCKIQ